MGRSGNPGSERTRPFLLSIDLLKKNLFRYKAETERGKRCHIRSLRTPGIGLVRKISFLGFSGPGICDGSFDREVNVENVNKKINKLPFSKFFVNFGQFPRNSGSVGKLRSKNELNLQPKEYDQGIGCWLLLPKLNLSREINRNLSNNSTNRPSRRCLIGKIELTESRPGTTLNLVTAQKQSDLSVCVTDRKSQYYGNAVCSLLKG